uniref:Lipase chaperone n=1 Tax=Heterorhabditis bacteriophora TaxID=37862 RepID=A0A1I7XB58_HETBA
MLNRVPSDPTGEIRNAIRELRLISQQLDPQMALYHRLRASYDYLFTLWRQATDPIGSLQDPLMRNVIAYLQADQAVAGAVMEAQAQARAQAQVQAQAQAGVFRGRLMMDLSQQHLALKVAAMNQYQLSTAGQLAPTASLPVRVTPMGPPLSADQALQQQRFIANQLAQMLSRTAQQPPL